MHLKLQRQKSTKEEMNSLKCLLSKVSIVAVNRDTGRPSVLGGLLLADTVFKLHNEDHQLYCVSPISMKNKLKGQGRKQHFQMT